MRIICTLVLNLFIIHAFSQDVTFKLNDLKGKTWSLIGLKDLTHDEKFEKGKILLFMNDKQYGTQEYYLSDTIVKVFDPKKIGKNKHGKYLIIRFHRDRQHPKTPQPISVLEIIELGPDRLVLRNIKGQYLIKFQIKE